MSDGEAAGHRFSTWLQLETEEIDFSESIGGPSY
jgi:hypothetical protein